MNVAKWISTVVASALLATTMGFAPIAKAETEVTHNIKDESIYDLLVDRYFNSSVENDYNVDARDQNAFAGGDLTGIATKLTHIQDMGFTVLSIGSIFSTESYDGSAVVDYESIERQFGTAKEFKSLLADVHKGKMKLMVDFPLNNVSKNHVWAKDNANSDWYEAADNGRINWNTENPEVQKALIKAATDFAKKYDIDGIRLTNLGNSDTAFLNEMIKSLKDTSKDIYVLSSEDSHANFDMSINKETIDIYQSIFKNVDMDSSKVEQPLGTMNKGDAEKPSAIMLDSLNSSRFTFASASENMYPPTRIKVAMAAMFTLPGVPVMTYGTEIAQNGVQAPESHAIFDFKTKDDIVSYIGDVQSVRNKSETLRTGDFKLLQNKDGFIVFERSSDDEQWIVVVNNTKNTKHIDLGKDIIGENKELHGLLESDIVRPNDKGVYRLVVDREIVELYQVKEHTGLNISYMISLGFVYVLFITFIVLVLRKGKKNRKAKNN
ncbi:alpha-amylase family glycosyl hydrolase [Viridibacillus arvi]|uniref:alpha-amylase family glycosyl hydrolase n=1 Tax=Viridibacillus arvi TaxID=263475 RepID=UPI00187B3A69|nr:alpha-amylase family glycosyl hydrolase [Viridibacillus sp. JNUCC-6]QOV10553.1 alpha-amylase [Viridibacillus sp. JNUCC-6]